MIILPGSKNTLADLILLRKAGLIERLQAFVTAGGAVVGICGGFQMLGSKLLDPENIESVLGEVAGCNLLPMATEMALEKITVQCRAQVVNPVFGRSLNVSGYEIHQGRTLILEDSAEPLLKISKDDGSDYYDGFVAGNGRIWGTYLHGIFDDDGFRKAYLNWLRKQFFEINNPNSDLSGTSFKQRKEDGFNALAGLLEESLDMDMIDRLTGVRI